MGSKTCTYILCAIRQLQPFKSLAGIGFPKFSSNYSLESSLPLLSHTCTLRSLSSATVPIRFVSYETSACSETKTKTPDAIDGPLNDPPVISDVNDVGPLNEHIDLESPQASSHNMCHASTRLALSKCTTSTEVLNGFSSPSYNKDELFEAIIKIWNLFLTLNEQQKLIERYRLVNHPHFHNLTQGVSKMAPVLSPGALVRTLYLFVHLKLPQILQFIQDLLCICQEQLSSLSEQEIAMLANTLELLKNEENVDLLNSSLRSLIDTKLEEVNGVTPLLTMMKAFGNTAPLSLKLQLENKALQLVDQCTVAHSRNLLCILADMDFHSGHLLNACSRKLIDGIDELSYSEIISVLSCCCELDYGNATMLTVIGDQIMKNICLLKPWQLAMILQYFVHLRFQHVPLLDRYAKIFTNLFNTVKSWDLSETVKVYSILNHLPQQMTQQFLEAVNTSLHRYLNSIPPKKLLYFVYHLCLLGVCPDFARKKLLRYKSILNLKERYILEHINMFLMIQKPFINSQSLQGLKKVSTSTSEEIEIFSNSMKNFIKNPDLYHQSLQIANTYYIDFLLSLDTQENKLVPVGDIEADDLQIADSSKYNVRIAVLCCTPNNFALGTLHPLGRLALKIRIIKSLGFSVVVVPLHMFIRMTEEERVKFLRTITFQELSNNQNVLEDTRNKEDPIPELEV